MRRRVSFFATAAFAVLLPVLAIAAASSPAVAGENLAPGLANTPAGMCINKLFQAQAQKVKGGATASNGTKSGIDDNCTNESITIDTSTGKQTIQQTGRVGNNDLTNGCVANSCSGNSATTCGTVTVTLTGGSSLPSIKPINKCDPNYQKELSDASGNSATASKNWALTGINQAAVQAAIKSNDPSNISSALQAFGVPQDQASAIAKQNTPDAANLLNALASGDKDQISQATSQISTDTGITLNTDTMKDISQLSPQTLADNLNQQGLLTSAQQTTVNSIENAPDTFSNPSSPTTSQAGSTKGGQYAGLFNQLEQQNNLPSGLMGSSCGVESGCNPNACNSGAYAQAPCGMFQYTGTTWTADCQRYNAAGGNANCALNMRLDPTTSAQVFAYNSSWYLNSSPYSSSIQNAINAGMDPATAMYAMHNLGVGDGPRFLNAYAANPGASVGSVITNGAVLGNPSYYGNGSISVAQAAQNLTSKLGGSGTVSTSLNAPSPFSITSSLGYGNGTEFYVATGQSPFANMSPIYTTPGAGSSSYIPQQIPVQQQPYYPAQTYPQTTQTYPTQVTSNPVTTQTNPTDTSSGSNSGSSSNNSSSNSTSANQTVTPVAQIIAQPKTVTHGNFVTVSWSSVGMNTCEVLENGNSTPIAQTDEGSQIVPTTVTGTLKFTLQCTAQSSSQQITEQSNSVTVD